MVFPIILSAPAPWKYTRIEIQGWVVQVGADELKDPLWPAVKAEMTDQLFRISRVVPDAPLGNLRTIVFWVHANDPATPCAAYHPGAEWLTQHGSDPQMAQGIEISNAKNFVSWTHEQPWMLLHELSHGFNAHFLPGGLENLQIKKVYDADMAAHLYERVMHYNGAMVKAYATTNAKEYFAECTEAYFGQNDFYPFVNAELQAYDPAGYQLMVDIWGMPVSRPATLRK